MANGDFTGQAKQKFLKGSCCFCDNWTIVAHGYGDFVGTDNKGFVVKYSGRFFQNRFEDFPNLNQLKASVFLTMKFAVLEWEGKYKYLGCFESGSRHGPGEFFICREDEGKSEVPTNCNKHLETGMGHLELKVSKDNKIQGYGSCKGNWQMAFSGRWRSDKPWQGEICDKDGNYYFVDGGELGTELVDTCKNRCYQIAKFLEYKETHGACDCLRDYNGPVEILMDPDTNTMKFLPLDNLEKWKTCACGDVKRSTNECTPSSSFLFSQSHPQFDQDNKEFVLATTA
jgi:hypothetical protein